MFSRPLAFVLLAVACVTAAAGGAYVATRHNRATPSPASTAVHSAPAVPTLPAAHTALEPAPPVNTPALNTPKAASAPKKVNDASTAAAPVRHTTASNARPTASAQPLPRDPLPQPRTDAPPANDPAAGAPVGLQPPDAAASDAAPPDPQPAPAAPQFDDIVIPVSSIVGVQIETPISSESAQVEDRVLAHVTRDVLADGRVAIPAGARVIGAVTLVDRGGKMKTPARLGIRFHTLVLPDGSEVPLRTQEITRDGESPSADSAKKIGGAAIVGAILGGILGGGKGAVIGGTTGAGAGTAAVMAGDRTPAVIAQGATLNVRLAAPATIQVERR